MTRRRVVALVVAGLALGVMLLDWTVGALDVFAIQRSADLRRVRASMVFEDGALVHGPYSSSRLGRGSFALETGADGQRTGASARASSAGALRILLLGDGAALGWGVDDALTFARGLELERAADDRAVAVTNAATVFFEPSHAPAQVERWAKRATPDLVLLCGALQAGTPTPLVRGIGALAPGQPWWARAVPSLWELSRRIAGSDAAAAPPEPSPSELEVALQHLGAVNAVVVDLGGTPGLAELCARLGLRRIDATFTPVELRSPLLIDSENGWPNALAHDWLEQRIARGLADLGVLAPPAARR